MKSAPIAQPAEGVCPSHQERHRQDSEPLRFTPWSHAGNGPLCWNQHSVQLSHLPSLSKKAFGLLFFSTIPRFMLVASFRPFNLPPPPPFPTHFNSDVTCDALDNHVDFAASARISRGSSWRTLLLAAWKGWFDREAGWDRRTPCVLVKVTLAASWLLTTSLVPAKGIIVISWHASHLKDQETHWGLSGAGRSHQTALFGFYTME